MSTLQVSPRRALAWLGGAGLVLVLAGIAVHFAGADPALLLRAHASAPTAFDTVLWSCLTVLALGWCALIVVLAADRGAGWLAALLLPVFIVGGLLTHVTKWLLAVPRPAASGLLPQMHVIGETFRGSVSMPSGHSVTAAAMAALLCLVVPGRRPAWRALLLAGAALMAASRVVVGAHWPSDTLVGFGLGLLSVALCLAAVQSGPGQRLHQGLARRIRTRAGQRCVAVVEVLGAVGLLAERTGYPAARMMVIAVAVLACASAAWRWRATRAARPFPALPDAPAERT
ncbi:phosphatase PAP2 family protein [Ramlibacter alkalitolerans]|uniref:Phosphatase PAP2 family protein n=1 Tax=Ramlibacter alkalitolerans TaxID=2039631 RepID=A0ABS1JTG9_9BURK|nr:phosphatase PAP2 family protein [Ramlibacter alkalitolerans]MBL0427579.1 phosphatase PAP2 family protein [Ramlibacter alkalitolerans]